MICQELNEAGRGDFKIVFGPKRLIPIPCREPQSSKIR